MSSCTDYVGVSVVANKRHVTPYLVDVESSATRLSVLPVIDDRAKPVSSKLDHAHTAVIHTAVIHRTGAAAKAKRATCLRHV